MLGGRPWPEITSVPGPLFNLAATPDSLFEALAMLWTKVPAARERVLMERREVRPHVNIFFDGESTR